MRRAVQVFLVIASKTSGGRCWATDGQTDGHIDERTDGQIGGRTVLFFQQIIYTQKSHGIIYKWLRDDLVIVVVSRCCCCCCLCCCFCCCYGLEHARRRPSPSIIVLAINANEICAYQMNPKTKKYFVVPNKSESRRLSQRAGSEKLIEKNPKEKPD